MPSSTESRISALPAELQEKLRRRLAGRSQQSDRIPVADRSMKAGRWDRGRILGVELSGKTLGVLGLGKVGREVAARARAFGMEVIGFDPVLSEEVAARLGVAEGSHPPWEPGCGRGLRRLALFVLM